MAIVGSKADPVFSPQGLVLGGFELVEKIGEGGMGEVWRARNVKVGSVLRAVKIIRPEFGRDPQFRERFLREAEYLELLRHPNIMRVDNIGEEGDYLFMVMELLKGQGVEQFIGGTSVEVACHILHDASQGIARAHQNNIFHRDIKPSNLFLTADGEVRVLDFGIARHEGKNRLTMTSASQPGTPAYYAPEMIMGKPSSGASDVYSLGITLYELLTGRQPFEPESGVDGSQAMNFMMYSHVNTPMPDARALRPEVPEGLAALIQQMTDKDPARRPPHARALAVQLAKHFDLGEPLVFPAEIRGGLWRDGVMTPLLHALPPAALQTGPKRSLPAGDGSEGTYVPLTPAPAPSRARSLPARPPTPAPTRITAPRPASRSTNAPADTRVNTQSRPGSIEAQPGANDETTEYRIPSEPVPESESELAPEDRAAVSQRSPLLYAAILGGVAVLGVGLYSALRTGPQANQEELQLVKKPIVVGIAADAPKPPEPRPEPKVEPKPESKVEPKVELKPEPAPVKPEPKVEVAAVVPVAKPQPKREPADAAPAARRLLGTLNVQGRQIKLDEPSGHKDLGKFGIFHVTADYTVKPDGLQMVVNTQPRSELVLKGGRSLGGAPQRLPLLERDPLEVTLTSTDTDDEPHVMFSFTATK